MNSIIELIRSFEQNLTELTPAWQSGLGISCVFIGLILWLAGFKFRKILIALAGLAAGLCAGSIFFQENANYIFYLSLAGVAAAVIIQVIFRKDSIFRRFLFSFIFAFVGSGLIFTGMTALLVFKGSKPTEIFSQKQQFFTVIFAAMVLFGTIEQVLLCSKKKNLKFEPKHCKDRET